MPRRPVKPQDRQRVVRACDQCKSSKKRCDGSQPCSACQKKGYDGFCHYTAGRRHHPLPQPPSALSQLVLAQDVPIVFEGSRASEAILSPDSWDLQGSTTLLGGNSGPSFVNLMQGRTSEESTRTADTRGSSMEATAQPSVMLSSVSGEKVFVGNTAAISFLQFLQKTLERHVGPSGFTDAQESRKLFEADAVNNGSSRFYDGLSVEDKKAYIQYFFDASKGLLDLYTWEEVCHMLYTETHQNTRDASPTSHISTGFESAALYLMVAIGAQCYGPTKDAAVWAAELFSFARKLAFAQMLESPCLDLVRVFLLMAFYMFGACRRNSAFMYLGIASKSADILGLHMSAQQKHTAASTRNARLRAAKSIRVFDVVCNSILGRSSSTPSLRPGQSSYVSDRSEDAADIVYRALALGATYEITSVLDTAVKKSAEGELDVDTAERLVLALQQKTRDFPSILRRSSEKAPTGIRHIIIGNMHVSGAYYFSVILITRQFLIKHIVPQLSDANRSPQHHDVAGRSKVDQLADACIEAATFMARMCHRVMKSGHLLGNMCILKAWMFATGLVLGFSLLTEDMTHTSGRQAAFLKSLNVMGELRHLSPQAEQYYGILSSFHQAINAYKERAQRKKRASRGTLVDCVFLPGGADDRSGSEAAIATQLPSPDMTMQDISSVEWLDSLPLDGLNDIEPVNLTLMGDNDIIMRMLWESEQYAMDYPAGMLPDAEHTATQNTGALLT
ncbi:uncharacterized protein M421DRAFT_54743 [Didymella exigua CBS 183.55]|uniref:Zn(2)-C6 fungal-type domain-containing protein n=1 Tax=Didymella exigua CBS 183.55 TaxID=1150837 RepID=A0A6A5RZJ3_9PLEO|nr:uncharacterized protein M421DRAFT_54743 [Didymella exigua CBS 183.55]KAF1932448.1 hypothetical protein M421DRAFT_54743 [Didymella exigua CBS 183.55]